MRFPLDAVAEASILYYMDTENTTMSYVFALGAPFIPLRPMCKNEPSCGIEFMFYNRLEPIASDD